MHKHKSLKIALLFLFCAMPITVNSQNLNRTILTQNFFVQSNTLYVIDKDYAVVGEITIPNNCVLDFKGGSISGGTLYCNNTTLLGYIKLDKTILKGTIENNRIESDWYGLVSGIKMGIDNGDKISFLVKSCENTKKDLHIVSGQFQTSKPVKFNADYNVYMDGDLVYTGYSDATAVYIGSNERKAGRIFYLSVIQLNYPSFVEDNNHYLKKAPRNIGVEVSAVYSSEFHIRCIKDFIYGLVLIDDKNLGCGDNTFYMGEIINAYNGIRIIAGNKKKQLCWVNDNEFIGGRIWFYENVKLKRTAIKFERLNDKGMADNTLFLAMDLENNYNAIDFGGFAQGCVSFGCRFENNENPIVNEGNNGNFILGGQKYVSKNSNGPRTYFDYASELWKQKINRIVLDIPQIYYAYDGAFISTTNLRISDVSSYKEVGKCPLIQGVDDDGKLQINKSLFFVDIDVSKARLLRIETTGMWRALMEFFDKTGKIIKPFNDYREHFFFYNPNIDGWYNGDGVFSVAHRMEINKPLEFFLKDKDITKIRLYIYGDSALGNCWLQGIRITTDAAAVVNNINSLFHLTGRPVKAKGIEVVPQKTGGDLKQGLVYFDSKSKPIFWNGNEWVDAMGNVAK